MTQPLPDRPTIVGQPQPLAGWPTEPVITPHAAIELYEERGPIVHIPDPYNPQRFIEVRRADIQPMHYQLRDLTPQSRGVDPMAQRMLYGGLGTGAAAAGVGWGLGEAAAGLSSGGGLLLLCLLAAWKLSSSRGQGGTHIEQHVHNHNRWLGKSTTNL